MSAESIPRLASFKSVPRFKEHLQTLHLSVPCDDDLVTGPECPLLQPLKKGSIRIDPFFKG